LTQAEVLRTFATTTRPSEVVYLHCTFSSAPSSFSHHDQVEGQVVSERDGHAMTLTLQVGQDHGLADLPFRIGLPHRTPHRRQ
jgi:hypothetical protein